MERVILNNNQEEQFNILSYDLSFYKSITLVYNILRSDLNSSGIIFLKYNIESNTSEINNIEFFDDCGIIFYSDIEENKMRLNYTSNNTNSEAIFNFEEIKFFT